MAATMVLTAAACGGDDSGDEADASTGSQPSSTESTPSGDDTTADGAAEAEALVAEAAGPLQWQLDAPPIDVSEIVGGQITVVTKDFNPFIQAVTGGIEEAAGAAGMTVESFNAAGDTSEAARVIDQAISRDVAAVVTVGFLTSQVLEPVRSAEDAGIPVVQLFVTDPGPLPDEAEEAGIDGYVSPCYTCIGEVMAQIVVADSGGDANVVFVTAPDVGVANLQADGFVEELRRLCEDCSVEVAEAPIAQWGTALPSIGTSAAVNEDVEYLVPVFDTAAPLLIPPLVAANAEDRVKLVSSNADLAQLQQMQGDELPQWVGNVGLVAPWIGWATVDAVLRALLGEEPVADPAIPMRAFTTENIDEIDLASPPPEWYGSPEFREEYRALWGLS